MELLNRLKPKEISRDEDLEYLGSNFELVDQSKIGELLGQGYEYRVYEYGNDKVLKIPKKNFLYANDVDDIIFNYMIGREFFNEFLIPTDIITKGDKYVIIQEKLHNMKNLTKKDLEYPEVRQEFENLLAHNMKIVEKGMGTVDLWGFTGVFSTILKNGLFDDEKVILDNVILTTDKNGKLKIALPDFDIVNSQNKDFSLKSTLVSNFAYLTQKLMTREMLGYNIG